MWCGIVVHIDLYLDGFYLSNYIYIYIFYIWMACLEEIDYPYGGDKQTREMSRGSS